MPSTGLFFSIIGAFASTSPFFFASAIFSLAAVGEIAESLRPRRGVASPYARALFLDDSATLDDLREAATTLEETERTARRVLGAAHPMTVGLEQALRISRAALRFRETPLGNAY